jgi:hypothetical protein
MGAPQTASHEFPICEICKKDLSKVLDYLGEPGARAHFAEHAMAELTKAVNAGETLINTLDWGELSAESQHAAAWFRQQLQLLEQMGAIPHERIIDMEQVS